MWLQNGNLFQFIWVGLGTLGVEISKLKEAAVQVSHWAPPGYCGDSLMDWREHPIIRVYTKIPWEANLAERSNGLDRHGLSFQSKGNVKQGPRNDGRREKSYDKNDTLLKVAEQSGLVQQEVDCVAEFFGPQHKYLKYPELRLFLGNSISAQFEQKEEVTAQIACVAITKFWPKLAKGKEL
jgi:hypothetical protein